MQPCSILLVEDDQSWREVLAYYLEHHGCTVLEAANGIEGLSHLRAGPVDLVLLDLMMPVLDGWGMMEAIRADPALAGTPVVAFSALDHGVIRGRLQRGGFLTFFPKPIPLRRVGEGVALALDAHRRGLTWLDAPFDVRTVEHEW